MTTQDEVEKEVQRLRIERYKDFIKRNRNMWREIKQLQAEVEMFENRESMALEYAESLKNCANCRHIIWDGEVEVLCSKNWVGDRFEKCRHWQKAGD